MEDKEHFYTQIDQFLLDESHEAKHHILADDVLVCECNCVSVGEIRSLFSTAAQIDIDKLRTDFHLGSGCGSCLKNFSNFVKNMY
jgi:NAD(P)H-nitrite reductase large subunit